MNTAPKFVKPFVTAYKVTEAAERKEWTGTKATKTAPAKKSRKPVFGKLNRSK